MKEIIAMLLVFMILLRGCGGVEHSEEEQKNELQSEQKNELEKEYDLGFYYKDGEIFSVDLNNVEPKQLSEDFADEDTGSEFDRWPFIHYVGNRVFFSDKGSDRSYKQGKDRSENIYYRDLADPDAKNILI
ncbi:MAG: hypothetical protein Q4A75_09945, partial [Peptostreptococcaceae bacterium]|nr:hypothetical protein [Peptostreptococcaceae bacterium]